MTKRKYPSRLRKTGPKKSTKGIVGRKWFNGRNQEDVVRLLCEVWQLDGSDREAALWAGITPSTLSDFLAKNPRIAEQKEQLKARPVIKARQTVVKDLDNPLGARWYLEKKRKKEFGGDDEKQNIPITINLLSFGSDVKQLDAARLQIQTTRLPDSVTESI